MVTVVGIRVKTLESPLIYVVSRIFGEVNLDSQRTGGFNPHTTPYSWGHLGFMKL
jgi:hypothetical protein